MLSFDIFKLVSFSLFTVNINFCLQLQVFICYHFSKSIFSLVNFICNANWMFVHTFYEHVTSESTLLKFIQAWNNHVLLSQLYLLFQVFVTPVFLQSCESWSTLFIILRYLILQFQVCLFELFKSLLFMNATETIWPSETKNWWAVSPEIDSSWLWIMCVLFLQTCDQWVSFICSIPDALNGL